MTAEHFTDETWMRQVSTLAEIIRASRERWRSRQAEEAGRSLTRAILPPITTILNNVLARRIGKSGACTPAGPKKVMIFL